MNQGPEFVVAALACLALGRAFVPLDSRSANSEWHRALEASGVKLVLYDRRNVEAASALHVPALLVDPDLQPERTSPVFEEVAVPTTDAYIYFTSGSTGSPKGVIDCHRNVLHNIIRYTNSLYICPNDRLSMIQSPSFSGCISSLLGALLNGACVCPFDLSSGGLGRLHQWVRDSAVTIYHSVPSIFRVLCRDGVTYPDVRLVRLEGDLATGNDVTLFNRHFERHAYMVNGLGATECGLVRQNFIAQGTPASPGPLPVGYPVPDVEVTIEDDAGQILPVGASGEIVLRSPYVAQGYVGRPDLTIERFLHDAEGSPVGYRTGDTGRLDHDNSLTLTGRLDAEVRIHGTTVHRHDIEKLALSKENLARAVALGMDTGTHPRVVLFYECCSRSDQEPGHAAAKLRSALFELPIPIQLQEVQSWPLTPDGKVDLEALTEKLGAAEPAVQPESVERQLLGLWRGILCAELEACDDVFQFGADSISVMYFVNFARERLGYEFEFAQIFQTPTSRQLAAQIRNDDPAKGRSLGGYT